MVKTKTGFFIAGKVRTILVDVLTGKREVSDWIENLIPTVGRVAIGRRLINDASVSNEGIITFGAVGTGTTDPNVADTKLVTEIARKSISTVAFTLNVITVRTFFTTAEANGTLTEYGLFGEDASGSVDTGTLFERVLISRTKTSAKTLTIESVITISNG